jgi:hypothetical protein
MKVVDRADARRCTHAAAALQDYRAFHAATGREAMLQSPYLDVSVDVLSDHSSFEVRRSGLQGQRLLLSVNQIVRESHRELQVGILATDVQQDWYKNPPSEGSGHINPQSTYWLLMAWADCSFRRRDFVDFAVMGGRRHARTR